MSVRSKDPAGAAGVVRENCVNERQTVIDSHVHFWDLTRFDYAWLASAGELNRTFLPTDLALEAPDLDGLVFVQADCSPAQSLAEAQWVHELAAAGAPVVAIVAHAQLERGTDCKDELVALGALPLVTGVRRLIQDEPVGFATRADIVHSTRLLALHGLSIDLCVRDWQLPEVTRLVERCPEVLFVLDHLGKPTIESGALAEWATNLQRLAERPNVRCKLSGLASEAPVELRTTAGLAPWLNRAIEAFGAERCFFGSDWPVVTSAGGYQSWLEIVSAVIADLSAPEISGIMRGNALATYHPTARDRRRSP